MIICPLCSAGIKINSKNRDTVMEAMGLNEQPAVPQIQPVSSVQASSVKVSQPESVNTIRPQAADTVKPQVMDTGAVCRNCGETLKEAVKFCPNCGHAVTPGTSYESVNDAGGNSNSFVKPEMVHEPLRYENDMHQGSMQQSSIKSDNVHEEFIKNVQSTKICPECHLLFSADKEKCDICGSTLMDKR